MTEEASNLTRRELLATGLAASLGAVGSASAQSTSEIPPTTRELWQWVRIQPVFDARVAYLDAATLGPALRVSMAAEYRAREAQSLEIVTAGDAGRWAQESTRLATRFGAFVGCDADEIVFTRGAGEALSTVAAGLDLATGDEVVTTTQEHPAALSPWLILARRRGIVVKQIELPTPLTAPEQVVAAFTAAITERTKVLAFSHVQYADGALLPVRELCQLARERSLLTLIDGAQAVGMLALSLRDLGCDFYAGCFHKWLGGSHGTGMLYVRREALDRLWPTAPRSIDASPPIAVPTQAPGQPEAPAALRKLGNIVPVAWPSLRGTEAAIDMHEQIGRTRIEARVRELAIYSRLRLQPLSGIELLTPARAGMWAGIMTLRARAKTGDELAAALAKGHRVYVREMAWPSGTGAVRASFNIFNTHEDVDRLVQGVQRAIVA
jgi:cysteine desulfurase / selenocysteine lyase